MLWVAKIYSRKIFSKDWSRTFKLTLGLLDIAITRVFVWHSSNSWGSDTTERLHFHFSLSCIGEGNGNPLQCSCLENPRDRGAWWAAIYGVAQSWTRLKWLSSSSIQYRVYQTSSDARFCAGCWNIRAKRWMLLLHHIAMLTRVGCT